MNLLFVFGTRPEAIKLAPLVLTLKAHFSVRVCVTGQHREMLDQVLNLFQIVPDEDLNLMQSNQTLSALTGVVLESITTVLQEQPVDWLLVQGDTTTTMAAAMAAFYQGIPIAHVEAGLRTYNLETPYPEEFNRQVVSRIVHLHFCPTETNRQNLLQEGISPAAVHVTGNTVIDALHQVLNGYTPTLQLPFDLNRKMILVTGHRRENFGDGFTRICQALKTIAELRPNLEIVYPVHLNPSVQEPVQHMISGVQNIHLWEPQSYPEFVHLMRQAYLILTDSGGVQEEAPSLGKPVLVMRETTERPEAVEAGTVKLVGTNTERIVRETLHLVDDDLAYQTMSRVHNPYGDGKACQRILEIFCSNYQAGNSPFNPPQI
ncbi:MAG: UDP-N-acetylglucosamine 2-epimerase (non-hydrolyzing) [SAR324 cluster bacterium]|nr:UDP-N-acetylglucosamine 2-epimerase (non-hydrolyzing) [SAR324 cluster bacterium]